MRLTREEQHALDAMPIGRAPTMPSISFEEFMRTAEHSRGCECEKCELIPRCSVCDRRITEDDEAAPTETGGVQCDRCSL